MKYEIQSDASVPLSADNRKSVTLRAGEVLDTEKFKELDKAQVSDLVKSGVLKKPAAKEPQA